LKNFQKFSKKNLSSKIPKNAQNVKKSSKIFFENFHSKNLEKNSLKFPLKKNLEKFSKIFKKKIYLKNA
jgi:hypothetical protein